MNGNAKNPTENQLYGGLNRRFERRAALLHKLRWAYVHVTRDIAACERTRAGLTYRTQDRLSRPKRPKGVHV